MDSRYPRYYREPPRPAAPRHASEWREEQAPAMYPRYDKARLDRARYEDRTYDRHSDERGYDDRRYESVVEPRQYNSRYQSPAVPHVRDEYYKGRADFPPSTSRYEREEPYPKYERERERGPERALPRHSYAHLDERQYETPRSRSRSPLRAYDAKKDLHDRERGDDRYVDERERKVDAYPGHDDRGRRSSLERGKLQRSDPTGPSTPSNPPSTPNETSHAATSTINRTQTASGPSTGPSAGPRGPAKARPPPRPQDDGFIRPRVGRLFPSIRPEAFKDIARYRTEALKLEEADKKTQKVKRQNLYEWECAQREVALADLRVDLAERNLEAITNNLAFS